MKDDQTAAAQSSDRGIRQRVRRIAEARMMAEDSARFEAGLHRRTRRVSFFENN